MKHLKNLAVFPSIRKTKSIPRILFLLLFFACAGVFTEAKAQHDQPIIYVCNEGKINLHYTIFFWNPGLFWDSYYLSGWYAIAPGKCPTVNNRWGGYFYIVFAVDGPNGEFGVVKYKFDRDGSLRNSRVLKEICVRPEVMNGLSQKLLPPCPKGFVAAPTSISIEIEGKAELTLNVTPSEDDYKGYAVLLREGEKPVIPETKKPTVPETKNDPSKVTTPSVKSSSKKKKVRSKRKN